MKRTKRMVLVPEDLLSRYEQKHKIVTSPHTAGMMQQDMAMFGILESENLTDGEKQKLYNANMENYLSLGKQKDEQIPAVRVTRDKEGEKEPLRDADVIAHLPVTQRPKAAALLKRLKANPGVISWDESGKVKVDGREIVNSNISDSISDAVRARKNFNPTGARELFRGLARINVPKDIAGNAKRWEEVQEPVVRRTPLVQTSPLGTPEGRERYYRQFIRGRLMTPRNWVNY
jgi:hypothetical protein